jgi:hypothetical protein
MDFAMRCTNGFGKTRNNAEYKIKLDRNRKVTGHNNGNACAMEVDFAAAIQRAALGKGRYLDAQSVTARFYRRDRRPRALASAWRRPRPLPSLLRVLPMWRKCQPRSRPWRSDSGGVDARLPEFS